MERKLGLMRLNPASLIREKFDSCGFAAIPSLGREDYRDDDDDDDDDDNDDDDDDDDDDEDECRFCGNSGAIMLSRKR